MAKKKTKDSDDQHSFDLKNPKDFAKLFNEIGEEGLIWLLSATPEVRQEQNKMWDVLKQIIQDDPTIPDNQKALQIEVINQQIAKNTQGFQQKSDSNKPLQGPDQEIKK